MKYFAILKDSLRETIDSKVFFVVLAISALAIFLMASVSLTPNPVEEGLQKITERFPDGSDEATLPIIGKIKATPSLTRYTVEDLKGPAGNVKPWEGEYSFVIESRDQQPLGGRIAAFRYVLAAEERKERAAKTGQRTRLQQLDEDVHEEARRIAEREEKKGRDRFEVQRRVQEEIIPFILKRLEQEVRELPAAELEAFVKEQLEDQGNWRVEEVKLLDLPPAEKTIKIKTQVAIKEGEDVHIKTEEVEGEVNKFAVKVTSRAGTYRTWPHKATLLFGARTVGDSTLPGELVYKIAHYGVGWVGAPAIMLLSCIITASYFPNMLRKGTIDLLLAKPVNRLSLLLYKYVGGLTFMFLNTVLLIVGLWVALGVRSGVWEPAFLYLIPILTFEFAMFYALSTLMAVLTRSPIVSILLCVVLWALLFGLGWGYAAANFARSVGGPKEKDSPGWVITTVDSAHAVLPHYMDLDWLGDKQLKMSALSPSPTERERIDKEYQEYSWPESLIVTALYIALFLGLASFFFYVRDY
jgi:ABC-type transport system involved in multi-copper enzyme maturation permease subunit